VKFKLDENMPADLLAYLREEGHDVADVVGEQMGGGPDAIVLTTATTEQRVLLT
jgi:hypothetical protein